MAISVYTDMVVRDDLFDAVFIEQVTQNIDAFNQSANGAIQLSTKLQPGHYGKTRFFDRPSSFISRRNIASTSAATPTTVTQDEVISVKVNRKGLLEPTIDSIVKGGSSPNQFTRDFAMFAAEAYRQDMLNTGLNAVEAALSGQAALINDYSGTGNLAFAALAGGMAKLGDRSSAIRLWVAYGKPYHDLLSSMSGSSTDYLATEALAFGRVPGFNKPFLVTDSAALYSDETTDKYYTLGLQAAGLVIEESEIPRVHVETRGGNENLTLLMQFEFAYNVTVKGFKWDTTDGGINPTDAAVATSTNWDAVVANVKDMAGVRIKTT